MGHIRKDNFDDGRFGNGSFFGHKLQFVEQFIQCISLNIDKQKGRLSVPLRGGGPCAAWWWGATSHASSIPPPPAAVPRPSKGGQMFVFLS